MNKIQPPSGGCVLKLQNERALSEHIPQPPSGGCVLKPLAISRTFSDGDPAAFGRLCVETTSSNNSTSSSSSSRLRAAVC